MALKLKGLYQNQPVESAKVLAHTEQYKVAVAALLHNIAPTTSY